MESNPWQEITIWNWLFCPANASQYFARDGGNGISVLVCPLLLYNSVSGFP
jgi:hypothetical protein